MECLATKCIKVLLLKGERKLGLLKISKSTNLEKKHEHLHMNGSLIN